MHLTLNIMNTSAHQTPMHLTLNIMNAVHIKQGTHPFHTARFEAFSRITNMRHTLSMSELMTCTEGVTDIHLVRIQKRKLSLSLMAWTGRLVCKGQNRPEVRSVLEVLDRMVSLHKTVCTRGLRNNPPTHARTHAGEIFFAQVCSAQVQQTHRRLVCAPEVIGRMVGVHRKTRHRGCMACQRRDTYTFVTARMQAQSAKGVTGRLLQVRLPAKRVTGRMLQYAACTQ